MNQPMDASRLEDVEAVAAALDLAGRMVDRELAALLEGASQMLRAQRARITALEARAGRPTTG